MGRTKLQRRTESLFCLAGDPLTCNENLAYLLGNKPLSDSGLLSARNAGRHQRKPALCLRATKAIITFAENTGRKRTLGTILVPVVESEFKKVGPYVISTRWRPIPVTLSAVVSSDARVLKVRPHRRCNFLPCTCPSSGCSPSVEPTVPL